jgi:hypothetical protein
MPKIDIAALPVDSRTNCPEPRCKHERTEYPDVDLVMIRDETGAGYTHKNGPPHSN